MTANKYRLVLEFAGDDLETYDRVVALEEKLTDYLETDEIDGHDVDAGVGNLFIDTTNPGACFKKAMDMMISMKVGLNAGGFRESDGNDYVRLWPEDDSTPFELK